MIVWTQGPYKSGFPCPHQLVSTSQVSGRQCVYSTYSKVSRSPLHLRTSTSSSLLESHPGFLASLGVPHSTSTTAFQAVQLGSPGSRSKLGMPPGAGGGAVTAAGARPCSRPPPGGGPLGRRCRTSVQGGAGWGSVYTAAGECGAPVGCCSSLLAASARVSSETASDCPCSPSPGLPHGLAKIQTSSLAWRRARM